MPISELKKNNSDFWEKMITNQDDRPYLICFDSKNVIVIEQGIFYKNTFDDMKNISDKKLGDWK